MLTFSAYYPVTDGTSMDAFTLPADQSSVEKIAYADYMTSEQTITRPTGGSDIQMQLERQMARVIVNIQGFGDQYAADKRTVSSVRINSRYSGIEDSNPTGSPKEITPYQQGNGGQGTTYTALVVPGYGDGGAEFITLTDGEGSTLTVTGIPELNAGNSYTFNLVVGKNKIEVASVTVQDWTNGETLAGGQATEQGGKTYPIALSAVTADYIGSVVTTDGNVYATADDATAASKTAVAMIAYVDGTSGLAIALADEGSMNWSTSKSTCENKTPAVTNAAWVLPSQAQWNQMINAYGGYYRGLNTAITTAGGTALREGSGNDYWSSTEYSSGNAYNVLLSTNTGAASWSRTGRSKGNNYLVRACLAFTCGGEAAAARPLADATTDDIGKIAGADGNIYDTKDAAEAVATGNAVAMIAYVGNASDCSHGMAIALEDESSMMNWTNAGTACSNKTPAVTGGTWRLPSIRDWQYMFIGCGASGTVSDSPEESMSYSGLASKLSTAGGTALQENDYYYWSSSELDGVDAWGVYFFEGGANFDYGDKDLDLLVRACLAF